MIIKLTYRILAGLIALGVAVQAASMAYAAMALGSALSSGATLNEDSTVGEVGFTVHSIGGGMVIPALSLILLIISFFTRIRRSSVLALSLLIAVVIQLMMGYSADDLPGLGWIHGVMALVIFSLALVCARVAATAMSETGLGAAADAAAAGR